MNPAAVYILGQNEPFRGMLLELQAVIERSVPEAELRFKYRIPFYYLQGKPFCYLNQSGNYVDLGFWHSAHLTRHLDKMYTRGRKVVKSLRYYQPGDIDRKVLFEVLEDAASQVGKSFFKP